MPPPLCIVFLDGLTACVPCARLFGDLVKERCKRCHGVDVNADHRKVSIWHTLVEPPRRTLMMKSKRVECRDKLITTLFFRPQIHHGRPTVGKPQPDDPQLRIVIEAQTCLASVNSGCLTKSLKDLSKTEEKWALSNLRQSIKMCPVCDASQHNSIRLGWLRLRSRRHRHPFVTQALKRQLFGLSNSQNGFFIDEQSLQFYFYCIFSRMRAVITNAKDNVIFKAANISRKKSLTRRVYKISFVRTFFLWLLLWIHFRLGLCVLALEALRDSQFSTTTASSAINRQSTSSIWMMKYFNIYQQSSGPPITKRSGEMFAQVKLIRGGKMCVWGKNVEFDAAVVASRRLQRSFINREKKIVLFYDCTRPESKVINQSECTQATRRW